MNLFIDTSNWNLIILLEKNNKIIDRVIKRDTKKVSDIFITDLNEMLNNNNLTIKDIKNLYVTTGPGSYTGVRIALTMAKTLKVLDNSFNVYTMNSLKYQAGNKKAISLLDARSHKYFMGIYDNFKSIVDEELILEDDLTDIEKKYNDYIILKDYESIDFELNYLESKDHFELIENEENLKPIYLKNFI